MSLLGGLAGMAGAVGYGAVIMHGLRTWWLGAVGTTALTLHVGPLPLMVGAVSGVIVAAACIWWTLRSLRGVSTRGLLTEGSGSLFRKAQAKKAPGPFFLPSRCSPLCSLSPPHPTGWAAWSGFLAPARFR